MAQKTIRIRKKQLIHHFIGARKKNAALGTTNIGEIWFSNAIKVLKPARTLNEVCF